MGDLANIESLHSEPQNVDDPILGSIGNTRILQYPGIYGDQIQCKLEYENPCGSMKDRIALGMILEMEERDKLSKGDLIVEASSGNTGAAVALVSNRLGYDCLITCPEETSIIKTGYIEALGSDIKRCPPVSSSSKKHYRSQAKHIAERNGGVWLNQYQNQFNPLTHYHWTGPEIANQIDDEITHFVGVMGTGGTVSGIGRYLKEAIGDIEIVGVDGINSNISNEFYDNDLVEYRTETEGLGKGKKLPTMWFDFIDQIRSVSDEAVRDRTLHEWDENGFLIGMSAASTLIVATEIIEENDDANVLTLICDGGEKYFNKFFQNENV